MRERILLSARPLEGICPLPRGSCTDKTPTRRRQAELPPLFRRKWREEMAWTARCGCSTQCDLALSPLPFPRCPRRKSPCFSPVVVGNGEGDTDQPVEAPPGVATGC